MNRNILLKTIAAAAMLAVAVPGADAASRQRTPVADLRPYVGSERTPKGSPAMTFAADGKSYLALADNGRKIVRYDLATGKELETVFDTGNTREARIDCIDGFTVSPTGNHILVSTSRTPIYRRSSHAVNYVYEVRSRLLRPLSDDHKPQRAPLFSPDGLNIAFVATDNNIYLKKLSYWTEVGVTTDGAVNAVINGVPDWTYEEEFTTASSMTWSPDSRTLCYLRYDESQVPTYSLPLYGGQCDANPAFELYPGQFTYKYPVAGEPNSVVTVNSYDVDNRKTKQIDLPDAGRIEYIPRITYAHSDDRLMVVTLNRAQTRMEIYAVNPRSTVARSVLVEESKAWLPTATYEEITWEPDGFVVLSGRSGHDHLYRYTYAGALAGQLTSGDFDVTAYYGHDAATGARYYQSTAAGTVGAISRVVSRIDRKGVATAISPATGTASARFTPEMSAYVLNYSNAQTPPVVTLRRSAGDKVVRTLADNTTGDYAARWASMPRREFFTFKTPEGLDLNGFMVKPTDFNASRRYPVVMYQYSGPGSQEVRDVWSVSWMNYYASKGYIVVCVDGRGTGGRGHQFMDCVYRNLGHYETIDQLAAARYVASLPYVDPARVGMHGWSFGGYETLMAVTAEGAPYAAAVAVAPVTDWRFYDTVYAERYMLTPRENESGYRESAPLNRTASLSCPLLVMWGTADDNVHPANVIEFMSHLEADDNYCDLLLFPNMNHSINGCGTQALVFARMLDYFNDNM